MSLTFDIQPAANLTPEKEPTLLRKVEGHTAPVSSVAFSPDGRTIAFRQNYEVFAMPLVPGGKPVDVSEKGGALPVTKVSTGGADYLGWANGGETLFWSIGPSLQSANVSDFFAAAPKADGDKTAAYSPPTTGIPLGVTVQKAKPSGTTVITGARVLTMRAGLADRVMAATNHELAEQTKLRATEDFKEGVKATAERRVANFKGR